MVHVLRSRLFCLAVLPAVALGAPRIEYCSGYFAGPHTAIGEEDAIVVHRSEGGDRLRTSFQRTDRSLEEVRAIYAPELAPDRVRGKSVLDVACGGGSFVRKLAQADASIRVKGVDLWLDDSQRAEPERFVHGDALALPFPDGAFDVVVHTQGPLQYYAWDSPLEELFWWRALSESLRVTAPDGKLLISAETPFIEHWLSQLRQGFDVVTLRDGTYRITRRAAR